VESGFDRVHDRLDDLVKVLMHGIFGLIGVLVAGLVSVIVTQV
jgi:hypothetical protein